MEAKISIARVLLNLCMRASARTEELSSQGAGATSRTGIIDDNCFILDSKGRDPGREK